MALIKGREVIAAVMARLAGTGVTAYISEGPRPPAGKTVVVHPIATWYSGPLKTTTQDAEQEFQTTCIGVTGEQALWTHDTVAERLWHSILTPATGLTTLPLRAIQGTQQPVMRDDELATPVFYVTCRWIAHVIPSA